jgi:uncharacterized membrane protein YgcG
MYLDMRQVFSIWFVPGYHARVRLVTVLDLVPCDLGAHRNGEPQVIGGQQADGGEKGPGSTGAAGNGGGGGRRRQQVWRISRQEDLYQVNEFLKFTGPFWWCAWRPLWFAFQVLATAVCVFLGLFVALSPWAFQKNPANGGVEGRVEQVETYHDDDQGDEEVDGKQDKPEGKAASSQNSGQVSGEESGSGSGSGGGSKGNTTNGNSQGRNSKAQSTPPRKSWKGGKKDGR